jgi:hypothetical protein
MPADEMDRSAEKNNIRNATNDNEATNNRDVTDGRDATNSRDASNGRDATKSRGTSNGEAAGKRRSPSEILMHELRQIFSFIKDLFNSMLNIAGSHVRTLHAVNAAGPTGKRKSSSLLEAQDISCNLCVFVIVGFA